MKNLFSTLAVVLAAAIPSAAHAQTPADVPVNLSDQKAIIVFFSRPGENYSVGIVKEGNTKRLIEEIQKKTGLETIEIRPTKPYPEEYDKTTDQVKKELANGYKPRIEPVKDISTYNLVILGYPIWWGEVPPPMQTWLETVNWTGKTILPVVTHEGSRFGSSLNNLENLAKGAKINKGLEVYGHEAQNPNQKTQNAIDAWLKKSGLIR